MINCWAPLFQDYKVKLVAESHAHDIKFTWPVVTSSIPSDSGFVRNDTNGIVYVGEGSWGAPLKPLFTHYSPVQAWKWTRNQASMPGFQVICVSKEKIEVRVVEVDSVSVNNFGQVGLNDPPCTLPANLVLWNPSNGSVVTIINAKQLSDNADLENLLTSGGLLNPVFSSTQYDCNVLLPDTAVIPSTISAILSDPNANVQVNQASSLSGSDDERTATAVVTAENDITTRVYSVVFSRKQSGLQEISAGKTIVIYPNPSRTVVNIDFSDKAGTDKRNFTS